MLGRFAAAAALIALAAGCAGLAPAGRNAGRAPAPPAEASAPAPETAPAPQAPAAEAAPPVAAPDISAPPPRPRPRASASDDEIIVPGGRETQVPPPGGDPRSTEERIRDIRAWDQCVMGVQSSFESDPMSPQLETPEDYCSRTLGMADRLAVPFSRRER